MAGEERKIKALVVDDFPDQRVLIKRVLEISGYAVSEAGSAAKANQLISNTNRPDVLILDVKMPNVDGITFLKELRARLGAPSLPALFISAIVDPDIMEAALAVDGGKVGYLTKPISIDVIPVALAKLLNE